MIELSLREAVLLMSYMLTHKKLYRAEWTAEENDLFIRISNFDKQIKEQLQEPLRG